MRFLFLGRLFHRLFPRRKTKVRGLTTIESMANAPRSLAPARAALVGPTGAAKWLLFGCPCGCGSMLTLNLMPRATPHWRVSLRRERLSVTPSLDAPACGSHFWITDGRIVWV